MASGTFLDKYKSNSYTVNRSYETGSVPSNLNSLSFEHNNSAAQDVLARAGPHTVYQRPGMHHEISNIGQYTTSINNNGYTNVNHKINEDPDPVHIVRPMDSVQAKQNVRVRYLEPPQLAKPAPIIIRERQLTPPPPPPPIVIRQRAPKPLTPPPLIIRERPPVAPVMPQTQIIDKVLPPPTPPPRQVIIERYREPERPRDIIYEKWLDYKPLPEREVIVERTKTYERHPVPKNLIIEYEAPGVHVDKNIYHEGIIRADPYNYHQQSVNGELRMVDKITDLPIANQQYDSYRPSWTNQAVTTSMTELPTYRPKSVVNTTTVARGPASYAGPWNTTYRTAYTGRGFNK